MGIIAILSFFVILFGALFIDGGMLSGPLSIAALLPGLGVAMVGLVGIYNFIKHEELPGTFHPRTHVPHST